jgi:hypothetical protein
MSSCIYFALFYPINFILPHTVYKLSASERNELQTTTLGICVLHYGMSVIWKFSEHAHRQEWKFRHLTLTVKNLEGIKY